MNGNTAFKDTRLLEVLDHIDENYLAEALEGLKFPLASAAPAGGKGKILRSLKYVAAVAACALLLGLTIPVVQYVTGNLSSFLPSGLLGSTDEYDPPYWEYTPELEPLSKETIENINRLFFISKFGLTPEEFLAESENKDEAQELIDNTRLIKKHSNYIYYGTFGDSVVASHSIDLMEGTTYTFDGLKLEYPIKTTVYVYNKGTLYTIDTAYEKGLLTYKNIELILERYQKYLNGHQ